MKRWRWGIGSEGEAGEPLPPIDLTDYWRILFVPKLSIVISKNKSTRTFSFNHLENRFCFDILSALSRSCKLTCFSRNGRNRKRFFESSGGRQRSVYIPPISCKKKFIQVSLPFALAAAAATFDFPHERGRKGLKNFI